MDKKSKIVVFGGSGLVGSAILANLIKKEYQNIIATFHSKKFDSLPYRDKILWVQVNLLDQLSVKNFFEKYQPEYVFLAAAKVGGILANNKYRADFIYQNIQIQSNVIHFSYLYNVKKLMFLGSTCIYPKNCPQPIKEEYLLTGPLEYTNEPYAIAKISGIKMCESYNLQYNTNFICVMPTNLYGPNDNFDLEKSHVLPALLRKFHLGKCIEDNNLEEVRKDLNKNPIEGINGNASIDEIFRILNKYGIKLLSKDGKVSIEIWGTGKPLREFLYSEDMADACVFLMENINFNDILKICDFNNNEIRNTHINIGTGQEISIKDLSNLIKNVVGFKGEVFFNPEKPDGTYRKVTDVSKIHSLGWTHKIDLETGIKKLYNWYLKTF